MTTLRDLIQRRPALSYYLLVFAISVGGGLVVMAPGGWPGTPEQVAKGFPLAFLLLYAGPLVAAPLIMAVVSGRAGFRDLFARLLRWRVGARWYAIALGTIPVLMAAAYVPLAFLAPGFLPRIVASDGATTPMLAAFGIAADDKVAMVLAGIVAGVWFGLLEEVSWTGFAAPTLRRRYGVLATGLIVGGLWGAWHVPITYWSSGDLAGALSPALFLPPFVFYVAALPAYRVLMVWVYDETRSLLVATLMHASLIASTLVILAPAATAGTDHVLYWLVLAAMLWTVVAITRRWFDPRAASTG